MTFGIGAVHRARFERHFDIIFRYHTALLFRFKSHAYILTDCTFDACLSGVSEGH